MKKLFEGVNQFIKECDWKDLALVKFCLCSIGIMIGLSIPREKKKCLFPIALVIFLAAYVPLMVKFGKIIGKAFSSEKN